MDDRKDERFRLQVSASKSDPRGSESGGEETINLYRHLTERNPSAARVKKLFPTANKIETSHFLACFVGTVG